MGYNRSGCWEGTAAGTGMGEEWFGFQAGTGMGEEWFGTGMGEEWFGFQVGGTKKLLLKNSHVWSHRVSNCIVYQPP